MAMASNQQASSQAVSSMNTFSYIQESGKSILQKSFEVELTSNQDIDLQTIQYASSGLKITGADMSKYSVKSG